MKGIVAEINSKYAIMLMEDGTFRKVKAAADMSVGEEIELDQSAIRHKTVNIMSKASAIAAAVLFIFGIGFFAYGYSVPYSYIDIDINPSVEIIVNIFDRIIGVEAFNDDGRKLMEDDTFRSYTLENGISELINRAVQHGYLKVDSDSADMYANVDVYSNSDDAPLIEEAQLQNAVLLTVSSVKACKCDCLQKEICKAASEGLKSRNIVSEVIVDVATMDQRDDAKKCGVSPGKLKLIQSAIEAEPDLNMDELKNTSVKELIRIARACKVKDGENAGRGEKAGKGEKGNEGISDINKNESVEKDLNEEDINTSSDTGKEGEKNQEKNQEKKQEKSREISQEKNQERNQEKNQVKNQKMNLEKKQEKNQEKKQEKNQEKNQEKKQKKKQEKNQEEKQEEKQAEITAPDIVKKTAVDNSSKENENKDKNENIDKSENKDRNSNN